LEAILPKNLSRRLGTQVEFSPSTHVLVPKDNNSNAAATVLGSWGSWHEKVEGTGNSRDYRLICSTASLDFTSADDEALRLAQPKVEPEAVQNELEAPL
jgi:hypothetical protein